MQQSLEDKGFKFGWKEVDSTNYLVRQRRNRVYMNASKATSEKYAEEVNCIFKAMELPFRFALQDVFDFTRPAAEKTMTVKQASILQRAKARYADSRGKDVDSIDFKDVFLCVDLHTSQQRGVEMAVDELPCIRPSSTVYCTMLERFVDVD